jgi:outer membrane protein assembly factor BamB
MSSSNSGPSSVATTAAGQLLADSRSPFRDRPIVAGLDARTGETAWTVTVAKGEKSPLASVIFDGPSIRENDQLSVAPRSV